MKAIILIGKPFSGKSTEAEKLLSEHPGMIYVNRDSFREALLNGGYPHTDKPFDELPDDHPARKFERVIRHMARETVQEALRQGFDVLVDETNLTTYRRAFWADAIRDVDPNCYIQAVRCRQEFPTQARRGYTAEEWASIRAQMPVEEISESEGFDEAIFITQEVQQCK